MNTLEFQAAVNQHAAPATGEADIIGIVNEWQQKRKELVEKARELGLERSDIRSVKDRLAREAEGRWMRTRYASLDLSFVEKMKQRFLLSRNADDLNQISIVGRVESDQEDTATSLIATVPVFLCEWDSLRDLKRRYKDEDASYWRRESASVRVGEIPKHRVGRNHYGARDVSMFARMPDGIDSRLFARVRRCLAYVHLFEAIAIDRGLLDTVSNDDSVQVGILWAPADDAWSVQATAPRPAGDPAILVRRGHSTPYLVAYFDTPDEKPIDHIIREFSEGPIKRKRSN